MATCPLELRSILAGACEDGRVDAACVAICSPRESGAVAVGSANPREDVAASAETLFHIGSVTKAITAELVWRLIDAGRLSSSTTIVDAAPELARLPAFADRRLTIAHLLSHTGGIDGDVIFDAGRGKDVLRRYMAQIPHVDLLFAPAAHFSYANLAYNVLGRIVEVVGGRAFEDALRELLCGTHGLSDVAILPEEKIRRRTALHFTRAGGKWLPSLFGPCSNIGSGTILAMSMPELARWGRALLGTGEVVRNMRESAVALPFSHRYEGWGFGVSLFDESGRILFGHDGGTAGTTTFLRIAPRQDAAWAFAATGHGAAAVYRQLDPVLRKAIGLDTAPVRLVRGNVPGDLAPYEGVYARHGMTFTVRRVDDALGLSVAGAHAPQILNGLILRPLNVQVFETRIEAVAATVWISFHDFAADGRPGLFCALERMAKRTQEHLS